MVTDLFRASQPPTWEPSSSSDTTHDLPYSFSSRNQPCACASIVLPLIFFFFCAFCVLFCHFSLAHPDDRRSLESPPRPAHHPTGLLSSFVISASSFLLQSTVASRQPQPFPTSERSFCFRRNDYSSQEQLLSCSRLHSLSLRAAFIKSGGFPSPPPPLLRLAGKIRPAGTKTPELRGFTTQKRGKPILGDCRREKD
ncbi:hypothetical protein QBC44DRAFT_8088 [Cladorrhinum sp. PSN332]|nr:hypothetical protein QBC44DRAFT_8088 [Cladorrhinum sp. PSN332]